MESNYCFKILYFKTILKILFSCSYHCFYYVFYLFFNQCLNIYEQY